MESEAFLPEQQTNLRKLERWWGSDCCLKVFNFSFSCISTGTPQPKHCWSPSLGWCAFQTHPSPVGFTEQSYCLSWGLLIYCPNVSDTKPGCSTRHITEEDAPSPWSSRDWWIRIQEGWVDFEEFFPNQHRKWGWGVDRMEEIDLLRPRVLLSTG